MGFFDRFKRIDEIAGSGPARKGGASVPTSAPKPREASPQISRTETVLSPMAQKMLTSDILQSVQATQSDKGTQQASTNIFADLGNNQVPNVPPLSAFLAARSAHIAAGSTFENTLQS